MIWLNELLRGSGAKSPGVATAPTLVDPDAARAALAESADQDERLRHAHALGCALAASQMKPLADDEPGVWAAAISYLADKSLALQWLERLSGDRWLGEVAAGARFAEVRLSAVRRIEDREVLRLLVHSSRGHDKGVFRHCSNVLRQLRQAADRADRAAHLADDLRELLNHAPLSVSVLLDLQREARGLGDDGSSKCSMLLEQAEARLKQESEARRALQACRAEAAELLAQCSAPEAAMLAGEQLFQWREHLGALVRLHAQQPSWLAAKLSSQALEATLRQIDTHLTAFESHRRDATPPEPPAPIEPVAAKAPVRPGPRRDASAVLASLERLEQALEQGHLNEADAAIKQVRSIAADGALHGARAARLQRAQARLAELSDWAKWGAQKKREQLIGSAEDLASGARPIDQIARLVPALRAEWKRANAKATPSQAEWERFDAALEKAYQPVAAQRAQEAVQRTQARADKEALCAEWDSAAAAIDWNSPDYTDLDARRQQMVDRWRALPHAGFRDERVLRKRFDKMLGVIDQRLMAVRRAEIERREQLIAEAETLRDAADLHKSIGEARTLQQRWRGEAGPLHLARPDEHRLWQRFRGALDAVFARRESERAEKLAHLEQQAQTRAALLDRFAAALDGTDAGRLKHAITQFEADWSPGRRGRSQAPEPLEQRARALQRQAQRRLGELHRQGYRERLERLAQQAAPVEGASSEAIAAGRQQREQLLIDLEIALDLPTPEAFAPARRRRQLERLQVRFRGESAPQPRAEDLLARLYAAPSTADAEMDARVAAVVRKLIEQVAAAGSSQ